MEFDWADTAVDAVWPEPPNEPRIRYLRSLTGPDDFREEGRTGRLFRWLAGEEEQGASLVNPYGAAADGLGRVWVTDPGLGVVHVFDLSRRRVDYLTTAGHEPFQSPLGVAFDAVRKRLYVSDSLLAKVFVFDEEGSLLGTRSPPEGYVRPSGLATDALGSLYVVDALRGQVDVFSVDGTYLRSLDSALSSDGEFNRPSNVFVDAAGTVFVSDSLNFRVAMIGADGEGLGTIGQLGDVPGTFSRPRGVAVDSDGHIYVADAAFDNIQVFDSAGRLLLYFGGLGNGVGQFNLPAGLFFDGEDRLYVVDTFNHRIQVFQYLSQGETE